MKIEDPRYSLIPSVWAEGFHLELIESSDELSDDPWIYAVVCNCCNHIQFEGTHWECKMWLQPAFMPNYLS